MFPPMSKGRTGRNLEQRKALRGRQAASTSWVKRKRGEGMHSNNNNNNYNDDRNMMITITIVAVGVNDPWKTARRESTKLQGE